ncbi:MAG TPA: SHOCT domain-containing protein [Gemmataceae bacterium]|jgi:hypothetical protein|nr:SHOCT domain-containing protein [Gemmataceae bacterium]
MNVAFSPAILLGAEKGALDYFDPKLMLAGGMLAGSLLLFAIIVLLVKRWRKKQEIVMPSASEQLESYRQLFDEGDLTKEEFERIRGRLLERIRKETGLVEKLAAPAGQAAAANTETARPAAPADGMPQDTKAQPPDTRIESDEKPAG